MMQVAREGIWRSKKSAKFSGGKFHWRQVLEEVCCGGLSDVDDIESRREPLSIGDRAASFIIEYWLWIR